MHGFIDNQQRDEETQDPQGMRIGRPMTLRPLIVSLSLVVPLVVSCDAVSERDSAPTPRARDVDRQPSGTTSDTRLDPVTAATVFEHVIARARRLAGTAYSPPATLLPPALASLDYDQYRSIRFRPEAALWHGQALFEVQLFHPGFLYRQPVRIHLVDDERVAAVPFNKGFFRYDGPAAPMADTVTPDVGYAGFRIHYPLNNATTQDEVVVFLGASYFRLLGRGHVYGLSSRGLAVDIALAGGEEFPAFREFWLLEPEPEATTFTLYALLDSPSVAGAYRFDLEPGVGTVLTVDARLYARQDVAKLGVAPMSTMFLYGQNRMPAFDDFRPQVHDSDGLLTHTAASEWIWRPLSNGPGLRVTSLRDRAPRGFGLVQRDRQFDSYLDLEANYHRRPSEWVAIDEGDWGIGSVELLVIPTTSEFNDNVAAYWVPDEPFRAGDERRYRYRLIMFDSQLDAQTLAYVDRTGLGRDALPGQNDPPPRSQRQFIVDFRRRERPLQETTQAVEARLETSAGQVSGLTVQSLPDDQGWRVRFRLTPAGNRPADLRLYLERDGQRVSETWSYVWYPERVQ